MTELQREKASRELSDSAIAKIARIAEDAGISMTELSVSSRVPYVNITRMFSGSYRRVITLRSLVALADAVGAKVEIRIS